MPEYFGPGREGETPASGEDYRGYVGDVSNARSAPAKRKPQSHHRNWGIVPSPKAGSVSPLMWTPMMAGTPPPYPLPISQAVPMPYTVPSPHDVPIPQAFAMPASPMPHAVPILQVSVKSEPTLIMNKQCLWCVCRKGERKEFCRKGKAEEHLDKQHLSWFLPGAAISCPDEYCQYTLIWGSDHFKNRAPRSLPQTHSCV